jgi:uncharacterized membrane protein
MNKILPNNQNNSREVVVTEISQSFSGPLPHPDVLRKFNEIIPGAAERIIKMAEDQSIHRKELEKLEFLCMVQKREARKGKEKSLKNNKKIPFFKILSRLAD